MHRVNHPEGPPFRGGVNPTPSPIRRRNGLRHSYRQFRNSRRNVAAMGNENANSWAYTARYGWNWRSARAISGALAGLALPMPPWFRAVVARCLLTRTALHVDAEGIWGSAGADPGRPAPVPVPVEGRHRRRRLGLQPPAHHRARPPRRCRRRRPGGQGGGIPRACPVASAAAPGRAAASVLRGVHRARRIALRPRVRGDRERLVRRHRPAAGDRPALRPARAVRQPVRRQRRDRGRRAARVRLRGAGRPGRAHRLAAVWLAARRRRRGSRAGRSRPPTSVPRATPRSASPSARWPWPRSAGGHGPSAVGGVASRTRRPGSRPAARTQKARG